MSAVFIRFLFLLFIFVDSFIPHIFFHFPLPLRLLPPTFIPRNTHTHTLIHILYLPRDQMDVHALLKVSLTLA